MNIWFWSVIGGVLVFDVFAAAWLMVLTPPKKGGPWW